MKNTQFAGCIAAVIGLAIYLPTIDWVRHQFTQGKQKTPFTKTADVYIQAGHEGRLSGATGASSRFGQEMHWTPIVADEATRLLRESGYTVIRAQADDYSYSHVALALSIHFDGSSRPCGSGASIGYDDPSDKPAADAWKAHYSQHFPYRWMPDNFTRNLSNYYNFRHTITTDAELVIEMGDMSCVPQAKWLKPRLKELGGIIASFVQARHGQPSSLPASVDSITAAK